MSGLNIGAAVNSAADWVSDAPPIRAVVSNPLLTAVLLTAIAVVFVLAMRQSSRINFRAIIYMFIVTASVLFIHHRVVNRMVAEDSLQRDTRDIFNTIVEAPDQRLRYLQSVDLRTNQPAANPANQPVDLRANQQQQATGGDYGIKDVVLEYPKQTA
jgi:hypothetical protein